MAREQLTSSPSAPLTWRAMASSWSHPEASRFVDAGGVRWHVQDMGEGPVLLLVHGAGASTHTWRDMMPELAQRFRVVAIDLPGHAFTDLPAVYRPTLTRVSTLLADLLEQLDVSVDIAVGHSAGAAILVQMVLDGRMTPQALVSFNGAFQPFDGAAGTVFPALAKMLFLNPLVPRLFALGGRSEDRVVRLLEGTGSTLDPQSIWYYSQLMQSPRHISGVLGMMANWDLTQLMARLPDLTVPTLLVAGSSDRAVPARVAQDVANRCVQAQLDIWQGLGHLAHEEQPARAVQAITDFVGSLEQDAAVTTQNQGVRYANARP